MINGIKILFRNLLIKIFKIYLSQKHVFVKPKTMLILRIDAIGDYILFRNFIEVIKKSDRYKDYKITVAGNEIWKSLAEKYDSEFVSKFVWIDMKKFRSKSNWYYIYKKMFKIHNLRNEILLIPNDTTSNIVSKIKTYSGVKNVIQKDSDSVYLYDDIGKLSSDYKSFNADDLLKIFFQFYRNKRYTDEITGAISSIEKPLINTDNKSQKNKYIVISPGAGYKNRIWSAENFGRLCKKISEISDAEILICGNNSDRKSAELIMSLAGDAVIHDKTGQTDLPELVEIISGADLLISNESCAVHIAACVNTRAVCLSNANHIGRFNPYPAEITRLVETIYPDEIYNSFDKLTGLIKKYHIISDYDINKITVEKVFESVQSALQPEKNCELTIKNIKGEKVSKNIKQNSYKQDE